MQIDVVNPIQSQGWDSLIASHEACSFFHSSSWARVLRDSYGFEPHYLILIKNGRLSCLLPVMGIGSYITGARGISLPFTDFCEPLLSDGIGFQEVLSRLVEYGKQVGWRFIELRGGGAGLAGTPTYVHYFGHVLDLSENEDTIFSSFRDNTKRNVRKAIANGVVIGVFNSLQGVREYYRLHCMTRREKGLPPPPFDLFRRIHEHILSKDKGMLILAYYEGKAISGGVYFHFGTEAVFKYGASDSTGRHLRGNNLVMWEAIKKYCHRGCKRLYFGRTDSSGMGLRRFKMGWGSKEYPINYYRYDIGKKKFISKNSNYGIINVFDKFLTRIPIPMLRMMGLLLYKHVG